ncbi:MULTISPECIES: RagB/SusD family nutrient uptake outer membrane protein [unclassified Carboxylicivirga]|uniref:RagB/SusD family nutrient uptake outer membrane protein n=1 Tax=Carboxylicivirga TaxID=1628153 RepID=UPI003D325B2E
MKKISIIFLMMIAFLSACDDVLDKKPYTSMPEEDVFMSAEGAQVALEGIYNALTGEDYYGRLIYAFEASKGPDFWVEDTGNRFERENAYRESSTSGGYAGDAWDKIYDVIFACNSLLEGIKSIQGEEAEVTRIRGEATAIRALAYFDLMRLFAYPPIFSVPGGEHYAEKYKMGVPLLLTKQEHLDALINPPGREDASVCYDQIVADFDAAILDLQESDIMRGKISYEAANALLGRVHLYLGEWDKAIEACTKAKDAGDMIAYGIYTSTYFKPFNNENIWELGYSETDHLGSNSLNSLVRNPTVDIPGHPDDGDVLDDGIGYAGYGGSKSLQAILNAVPSDLRSYLICDNETGRKRGIRKYIGVNGAHNVHNIPIVRLPEVLLTLAEAEAESNSDLSMAAGYLNEVYKARTDSEYELPATKEQLIEDILLERRKELVLEGHTFWDYFRRAIPFEREEEGNVNSEVAEIDYTQPQVVYPIPQNEMEANKNIRGQQNPGYDPYTDQ